jgi:hypothetical protein
MRANVTRYLLGTVALGAISMACACGASTPGPAQPGQSSGAAAGAAPASSVTGSQASGGQASGGQAAPTPSTAQSVVLDKTVWWEADINRHWLFKIHVTKAEVGLVSSPALAGIQGLQTPAGIPSATITFDAQNLQAASRTLSFGSETTLTANGKTSPSPEPNQLDLAASATGSGTLVFQVDPGFRLADATLTLGGSDTNQEIIPLAAATAVTTVAPKVGFLSGKLTGSDWSFAVSNSILYADTTSGQQGKLVMVLTVMATRTSADLHNPIGPNDFSLVTPDGSTTPGVQVVGEPLDPLNSVGTVGATSPAMTVGFIVAAPGTGSYTLGYASTTLNSSQKTAFPAFSIA